MYWFEAQAGASVHTAFQSGPAAYFAAGPDLFSFCGSAAAAGEASDQAGCAGENQAEEEQQCAHQNNDSKRYGNTAGRI